MEKRFFEITGKLNAWNYAISMRNATECVRTGYHLAKLLLEKRKINLQEIVLNKSLSSEEHVCFPPGDTVQIGNEEYSIHLLLQMCAQSVFQNAHSFFDYLAQCINCIFVDTPLSEANVSFHRVEAKCNNPTIKEFMKGIEEDSKYKLICDYNNKTKHYHMLDLTLYFAVDDYTVSAKTAKFTKPTKDGEHTYSQYDFIELIKDTYELLYRSFNDIEAFINCEFRRERIEEKS